ncbi:hypothetical protein ANCDUO_02164 [Ancylostoma duodenale]|uniref:Uncharacterized protein n=1 Tax=Ancylostoma duodenale TaxID=51022 RepID=A0A0C2DCC7_9BILA|nr:hypothetical protein ANCDUO_02164 [Ancylostoma duodenale]
MRVVARSLKLGSTLIRASTFRYCSAAESSGSNATPATPSSSTDDFDEFVDSLGRDITDMNKWMYIVPVVIFVVISNAMTPEGGGEG